MTVYQFDEEHKYIGNSTSTGTEQERNVTTPNLPDGPVLGPDGPPGALLRRAVPASRRASCQTSPPAILVPHAGRPHSADVLIRYLAAGLIPRGVPCSSSPFLLPRARAVPPVSI